MADKTFIKSGNVTNAADETINIADLLTDIKTVLESLDVTVNASDINIGNVDVVTLPELPAGTQLIGKVGTANASDASAGTIITVTTNAAGTTIAAANADRISITLLNTGTEPCLVLCGAGTPSVTAYNIILSKDAGIRLGNGGSITISDYTGVIKGITESGSTTIAVLEV